MVKHLGATDIAFLLGSLCSSPGQREFGMTFTKSPGAGASARPRRKSPLRAATLGGMAPAGSGLTTAEILTAGVGQPREAVPAPDLRRMQISEFTAWLRSRTNKHHRPFQADTIAAYADAARALGEWMGEQGIDGDFTACDAGGTQPVLCPLPGQPRAGRHEHPAAEPPAPVHLAGGDLRASGPAAAPIRALELPFMTADFALRDDRIWRLIQVGDRRFSDRPATTPPQALIATLQSRSR